MRSSLLFVCIALFCIVGLSFQQIVGGYEPLTNKQVYSSKTARGALNFGAKQVAQRAIAAKRIPNGVYSVYRLLSAQQQIVAGINYRFHAYIRSANHATLLDARYTVYHALNGTNYLTQSTYKVLKGGLNC